MLRVGKAPLAELHGRGLRVHAGNISAAAGTMFSREIYTMLYDSRNQEKTLWAVSMGLGGLWGLRMPDAGPHHLTNLRQ